MKANMCVRAACRGSSGRRRRFPSRRPQGNFRRIPRAAQSPSLPPPPDSTASASAADGSSTQGTHGSSDETRAALSATRAKCRGSMLSTHSSQTEGRFVKTPLLLPLAAAVAVIGLTAGAPRAQAQVDVDIDLGVAPECPYGYYDYEPYDCAPYGYYGPEWFTGDIFIGAGPWFHGRDGFRGGGDHRFDRRHGYRGPMPHHGDRPDPSHSYDHMSHLDPTHMHDGRGHESPLGGPDGGGRR